VCEFKQFKNGDFNISDKEHFGHSVAMEKNKLRRYLIEKVVENKWKITTKKMIESTLILIYIDFFIVTKIAKNRQELHRPSL